MLIMRCYRTVDSTNDETRRLLEGGLARPPVLVVAGIQLRGRGRQGRTWSSPPGGLWMTLAIQPRIPARQRSLVPLLAGVAAARAVVDQVGLTLRLKWPNDLMWRGRKLGGVLCESWGDVVLAGIGINLAVDGESLPPEVRDRAVSLREAGLKPCETGRNELAARVAAHVLDLVGRVEREGLAFLLEEYRGLCLTLGRQVTVHREDEAMDGLAVGLDDTGALLVQGSGGVVERVTAGDVSLSHAGTGDPASG